MHTSLLGCLEVGKLLSVYKMSWQDVVLLVGRSNSMQHAGNSKCAYRGM